MADRIWKWSNANDIVISRQLSALFDPERSEVRILAFWGIAVVASTWAFMSILEDVVNRDLLVLLDVSIHDALQGIRTSVGDHVMVAITELGDSIVVFLVASIIFLWFIWQRHWRTAAYWAAATGFAAALNTGIKLAVHRARPGDLLYSGVSEFSFPSGHSTVNTVMYGFLAFLIARQLRPAVQVPLFAAALGQSAKMKLRLSCLIAQIIDPVVSGRSMPVTSRKLPVGMLQPQQE